MLVQTQQLKASRSNKKTNKTVFVVKTESISTAKSNVRLMIWTVEHWCRDDWQEKTGESS
jgi:hypothetical protein